MKYLHGAIFSNGIIVEYYANKRVQQPFGIYDLLRQVVQETLIVREQSLLE